MRKRNIIIISVLIVLGIIGSFRSTKKDKTNTTAANTAHSNSATFTPIVKDPIWSYDSSIDEMTSKMIYYARTKATNYILVHTSYESYFSQSGHRHVKINRRLSYTSVMLVVKKLDRHSEVYFTTSKGQFDENKDYIRIRYDQQQPVTVDVVAAESDSRVIFIKNAKPVIAALKKAEHIIVEAGFYDSGLKNLKFDVSGLNWEY